MRLAIKVGLLVLVTAVAAAGVAPTASASYTCTNRLTTCVVTFTATVNDPSRSRSTAYGMLLASSSITCSDTTISTDGRGASSVTTGAHNITFTGSGITFTGCRTGADAGCTVTTSGTAGDSFWTLRISSSPRGATSYDLTYASGVVTVRLATCTNANKNGTITFGQQTFDTRCVRYTPAIGLLSVRCTAAFVSTAPAIPSGNAIVSVSYHAVVDATGLSPTVSNDP
jgi:hypothetical protein